MRAAPSNSTCQLFIDVLTDGLADAICIDAAELAASIDVQPDQQLTWLASATANAETMHIFFCEAGSEAEQFICTVHAEDGRLLDFSGPFDSYAQARQQGAPVFQDWTET